MTRIKECIEKIWTGYRVQKEVVPGALHRLFFQKYIPEEETVLEIGAGYCEFINNIKAKKKNHSRFKF